MTETHTLIYPQIIILGQFIIEAQGIMYLHIPKGIPHTIKHYPQHPNHTVTFEEPRPGSYLKLKNYDGDWAVGLVTHQDQNVTY